MRWIYYEREAKFLNRSRPDLGDHLKNNEFLLGAPNARRVSESRPLVLSWLFDLHVHDWGSVGFPAELHPDTENGGLFTPNPVDLKRRANLAAGAWAVLKDSWKLKGDLTGPDAKYLCRLLFRYCLAISHAPQYESDYKDSLAQDWPHVPICKDAIRFKEIALLGEWIASLLDPQSDAGSVVKSLLGDDMKYLAVVRRVGGGSIRESDLVVEYSYFGSAAGRWERRSLEDSEPWNLKWGKVTGDLYLSNSVYLKHVPEDVWHYEMGGYPILKGG